MQETLLVECLLRLKQIVDRMDYTLTVLQRIASAQERMAKAQEQIAEVMLAR